MNENNFSKTALWCRWIGRISSLIAIVVLSAFLFGGNEPWTALKLQEIIGLCLFPGGVVLGFLVAWRYETFGGCLSVLSLLGFYIWHFARVGNIDVGPYFLLFSAPAFFFLLSGTLAHKASRYKPSSTSGHSPSMAAKID